MICYAVLPRVFCQFRVKNGAANCMSLFLFYFPKELHADGQHTDTRVSLPKCIDRPRASVVINRSSDLQEKM
jgi:hypothetical protein